MKSEFYNDLVFESRHNSNLGELMRDIKSDMSEASRKGEFECWYNFDSSNERFAKKVFEMFEEEGFGIESSTNRKSSLTQLHITWNQDE